MPCTVAWPHYFLARQLNLELTGGECYATLHAFHLSSLHRVWQDCTIEGKAPSELVAAAAQGAQGEPISIEGTGGVLVIEILGREEVGLVGDFGLALILV